MSASRYNVLAETHCKIHRLLSGSASSNHLLLQYQQCTSTTMRNNHRIKSDTKQTNLPHIHHQPSTASHSTPLNQKQRPCSPTPPLHHHQPLLMYPPLPSSLSSHKPLYTSNTEDNCQAETVTLLSIHRLPSTL